MQTINPICREILDPIDPVMSAVQSLYEGTQAIDEQIPFEWIKRSVSRRKNGDTSRWIPHLVIVEENLPDRDEVRCGETKPSGFAYGCTIPNWGGYISYIGVDIQARKRGTGTILFQKLFELMEHDAVSTGIPLDYVLWESRQPKSEDTIEKWQLWSARIRLFHRVGGYWIRGLDFHSPNFLEEAGESIPLQLFIKPMRKAIKPSDSGCLKRIAEGLHEKVYRHSSEDALYQETFPEGCLPTLASPLQAERTKAAIL